MKLLTAHPRIKLHSESGTDTTAVSSLATPVPFILAAVMNIFGMTSIETAYRLALILGLFNYTYDRVGNNFKERTIFTIYHRSCVWIVRTLSLAVAWGYCIILLGYKSWEDTARIQDRFLWFMNIVQLYLGVLLTYTNHSQNQPHLLRMLNRIVKCNRDLVRLLGKDDDQLKSFYFDRKVRIMVGTLDILTTWFRPLVFQLITYEWKTLVVANKLVLMSSFLGQHYVQTFIGTSFHQMECFVRTRSGNSLSAEECRILAKICTQLHKIRVSSNEYHGAFGLISYLSLIRTICLFFSSFSALFTSGIMRFDLLSTFITYFFWMILPGLAPLIDLALLGAAADAVNTSARDFYFRVYSTEHRSEARQMIDCILRREHLATMQTLISSGVAMDRSFSFAVVMEVLSWVAVFFVYNGGRFNIAALAMVTVNLRAKPYVYAALILGCSLYGLLYCIYAAAVCLKKACKRMIIPCCGKENI